MCSQGPSSPLGQVQNFLHISGFINLKNLTQKLGCDYAKLCHLQYKHTSGHFTVNCCCFQPKVVLGSLGEEVKKYLELRIAARVRAKAEAAERETGFEQMQIKGEPNNNNIMYNTENFVTMSQDTNGLNGTEYYSIDNDHEDDMANGDSTYAINNELVITYGSHELSAPESTYSYDGSGASAGSMHSEDEPEDHDTNGNDAMTNGAVFINMVAQSQRGIVYHHNHMDEEEDDAGFDAGGLAICRRPGCTKKYESPLLLIQHDKTLHQKKKQTKCIFCQEVHHDIEEHILFGHPDIFGCASCLRYFTSEDEYEGHKCTKKKTWGRKRSEACMMMNQESKKISKPKPPKPLNLTAYKKPKPEMVKLPKPTFTTSHIMAEGQTVSKTVVKAEPVPIFKKALSPKQPLLPCGRCTEKFANELAVIQHYRTEHQGYDKDICVFCNKWQQRVFQHIAIVHKNSAWACINCYLVFSTEESLKRHECPVVNYEF